NHIVVNESSAMQQLDNGSQANRAVIFAPSVICRQKQERRTQALAPAAEQIGGNFRHRGKRRVTLTGKLVFHQSEVVADEIEHLFDREQFDGLPPGPFYDRDSMAVDLWGRGRRKRRRKFSEVAAAISSAD